MSQPFMFVRSLEKNVPQYSNKSDKFFRLIDKRGRVC